MLEETKNQSPTIVEHSSYYFQDVIFLVENTLFKVPRHYFELGSPFFRDMFSLPLGDGKSAEGYTNENPLRLDGYNQDEFLQFLIVLCPRDREERRNLTINQWRSALKLATIWQFQSVRESAIAVLTAADVGGPVVRLELAMAHNVPEWYWLGIWALTRSPDRLSVHDAHLLGIEFSLRMAELRGRMHRYPSWNTSILGDEIRDIFKDEVGDVPVPKTCR